MDDRFNTASGWVLFAGIVALGASIGSGMYFHADSTEYPEGQDWGYFVEGAEEEGGADAGPDLGTLLASADATAGEKVFAKCTACHTINQGGANGIGPNLYGIIGKPVGKHAAGFAYSSDLSGHGGVWDYANLDEWLKNPRAFASGTKMSFAGLGKPEDRANVIAYMKANGGGPEYPAPVAAETPEAAEGVDATPGEDTGAEEAGAASPTVDQPATAQPATANPAYTPG